MKKKSAEKSPKRPPRKRIEKKTILWATAGFLVSLWMFVLGLLVGRGTAPVEFDVYHLQKKIAGLKKATVEKTTQRYKIAFEELDKKIDLGFHEALPDPKLKIQAPEPAPGAGQLQTEKKVTKDAVSKIPHKAKKERFQKKLTPPAGMVIQVVATKDEGHAEKVVAKLKTLGYHAYRTIGDVPGKGTWHRVRVGGFKNVQEAKTAVNQLKDKRFSPIIIR